ncbi:MAG: acyltransferase family protein [Paracoccaceae bacterium]
MSKELSYRPEIDGLRAIAVMSVVVFHAYEPALPGGFVGVDIFFVISGFLITSIIAKEIADGSFSIATFYERRIRRIFPSLFVVLLACIPFAWILMTPGQLRDFSQSVLATGTFLSNIYFFLKTGYFEQDSHVLPLLHTRSLAVEEQYYVLFPLLMLLLARGRHSVTVAVLALLAFGSLALSILWGSSHAMMNFFLLPSRGWELLSGALLALVFPTVRPFLEDRPRLRAGIEVAGIVGLLHGLLFITSHDPFPGLLALPAVWGTVALIASMKPDRMAGRVLSSKLAVGIGMISYSAYLWHQPLFAFARIRWGVLPPVALVGLIALTLILAFLSWRFVERPFRNRQWLRRGTVLWLGAAMIGAMAVVGGIGHLQKGFPNRFDQQTLALAATAAPSPRRAECHTEGVDYRRPSDGCIYGTGTPTWAVLGDSHGVELALALGETLGSRNQGLLHLTFSGCPPAIDFPYDNPGCREWTNDAVEYLELTPQISNVLIVYRAAFHLYGEHGPLAHDLAALHQGTAPLFLRDRTPEAAREAYWNGLRGIVDRLVTAGKTVYVLGPVPELPVHVERIIFDTTRSIGDRSDAPGASVDFLHARYDAINARLAEFEGPHSEVVSISETLCDSDMCRATQNASSNYFDDNHLSMAGARVVVDGLIASGRLPLEETR